jgi:sigma-B regulation protein RsbU (phosphoserine phosphatase)
MLRLSRIPRPALRAAAILFALATTAYSLLWMSHVRRQPRNEPLGVTYREPLRDSGMELVNVEEGGPAHAAGLRTGDRIMKIAGLPLRNPDPYFDRVIRGSPGDRVALEIARPAASELVLLEITLQPTSRPAQVSFVESVAGALADFYPLLFLILGLYVLFLRMQDGHAWVLALLFAAFIAGPAFERIRPLLHPDVRPWTMAYAMTFAYLGPAFFYGFFTTFPDPSPIERRAPWLKWVVLAICSAVALPAAASLSFQGTRFPFYVQAGWMTPGQFAGLLRLVLIGFVLLGFAALITNAFEEKDKEARRRFRVVLWGTLAGFGPEILRLILAAAGVTFAARHGVQLACLALLMLVPISMGYAVVKYRVMEIPDLLRRSARYVLVRRGLDLGLAVALLFVVYSLSTAAQGLTAGWRAAHAEAGGASMEGPLTGFVFVLGLALGAVLVGTQRRVRQRYVERLDRAFFRSVYNTQQVLQDLAEKLQTAAGREALAGMLEGHIVEALHPQSLAVYFRVDGQLRLERFGPGPIPTALEFLEPGAPVLKELALRGRPWEVPPGDAAVPPDLPELGKLREHLAGLAPVADRSDVLAQLVPLQPECLVPVLGHERVLLGLLVLGPRLSEEPYSDEDEKLLASVAGQAGVTLDNIRLAEEMAARLEAENKRANEMSIAREVQSKLFPQKMPPLVTLDYAGSCDQARTIGGDYYDYLNLGPGRVGLVLADISGKGIFAALLMANLQANLRSQYALALTDRDGLRTLMRAVNRLFVESVTPGLYATIFIVDYADQGRCLRFVNCGHNPPLLLRAGGACEKLDATATVVGLLEDWDCTVGEVTLAPGDTLVIYSDGVTEASSDADEFFGDKRLEEVLRANRQLPAAELARKIATTVHTFSGKEQEDDLTLLVARAR